MVYKYVNSNYVTSHDQHLELWTSEAWGLSKISSPRCSDSGLRLSGTVSAKLVPRSSPPPSNLAMLGMLVIINGWCIKPIFNSINVRFTMALSHISRASQPLQPLATGAERSRLPIPPNQVTYPSTHSLPTELIFMIVVALDISFPDDIYLLRDLQLVCRQWFHIINK